jgi:hypothetical protein
MNALLKQAAPYVLALAIGGGWLLSHNAKQRELGAAAVRDSINAIRIQALTLLKVERDTIYQKDTVIKWRVVARAETLLTTLLKSDTVTLTRRESVIVFAADSAIQACRSIVLNCEARVAVRDSLISSITADRDVWKRRGQPSFLSRLTTAVKWTAIGYGIAKVHQ